MPQQPPIPPRAARRVRPSPRLLGLSLVLLVPVLALGAGRGLAQASPAAPVAALAGVKLVETLPFRLPQAAAAAPAALPVGGPDAFGYTYDTAVSHPAHGLLFQDIAGTGSSLGLNGSDDASASFNFPADFNFHFYGSNKAGQPIYVSTNGFASFTDIDTTAHSNTPIPDAAAPLDGVFPFWDDLLLDNPHQIPAISDQEVYWQVVGGAPNRRLIIQWNQAAFYDDGNGDLGFLTFQVQFDEATGDIRFEYLRPRACAADGCFNGSGGSATIGIESADPANAAGAPFTGLQFSLDEPSLRLGPGDFLPNVVFHDPDLAVQKECAAIETDLRNPPDSGTAAVVLAGQQWVCRVTVTNRGAGAVANVILEDSFGPGLTLAGVARTNLGSFTISPAPPVLGASSVEIGLGTVPAGASAWFELGFLVSPAYVAVTPLGEGEACNRVSLLNPLVGDAGDAAEDCDLVKDRADLGVQKLLPQATVQAGETFVYTIMVDNTGPSAARGVRIVDDVLSSGAFSLAGGVAAITSDRNLADLNGGPPGFCALTTAALPGGGQATTLECALANPMEPRGEAAPGGAQSGRWVIRVPLTASQAQAIVNKACVRTQGIGVWQNGTPDQDSANNCAEDPVLVTAAADLAITKTDGLLLGITAAGADFDYSLTVTNNGPSTATNVVVTDKLPLGLALRDPNGPLPPPPISISGPAGPSCTASQGAVGNVELQCNLGSMASGSARSITVRVTVGADLPPQLLVNRADVWADSYDPVNANNVAREETTLGNLSVLEIEKDGSPDPVTAGGVVDYRILVTNEGPSVAHDVTLRDVFADIGGQNAGAFLTLISANFLSGAGSCYLEDFGATTDLRCSLGDIAVGATLRIDLKLGVAADTPQGAGILANAVIPGASSAILVDLADSDLVELIDVVGSSQVVATKTASDPSPVAGTEFSYDLTVTNNGPSTAYDVQVIDPLPSDVTFVAASDARCGAIAGTVLCDFGDMAPGQTISVTITVRLEADAPCGENLTNIAIVLWDGDNDGTLTEVTFAASTVTVDCVSDLRVTKLAKPDGSQSAGQPVAYTIVVDNLGPSAAPGVAIKDLLQSDGRFDVVSVDSDRPASCDSLPDSDGGDPFGLPPAGGAATGVDGRYQLDCTLTERLSVLEADGPPNSGRWILSMEVLAETKQSLNNVATVVSGAPDPDQANNQDQTETQVTQLADLRVVKFGKPDGAVRAGEILTYTIIVDNLGPNTAPGVALKDILRSDGTFDVISIDSDNDMGCASDPNPPSGSGTPADPLIPGNVNRLDIDCLLADPLPPLGVNDIDGNIVFPNPGRWLLTMYVQAREPQTINNVADVLSDIEDPNSDNNHAQVRHDVTSVADLALVKSGPANVIAGTTIAYSITVTNLGPSTSENTTVYDRLPPGITVTSATAEGGSCNTGTPGSAADRLVCQLGSLLPGEERVIDIVADVDPDRAEGSLLENDAFVLSDVFDDYNANNADYVLTEVDTEADIWVSKFCNPLPILAGEPTSFDIVFGNDGDSTARDVILTDVLPPSYDLVSAFVVDGKPKFDSATCFNRGEDPALVDSLTCELGDIAPGQGGRIVVTAFVRPNAPAGPYTNTVFIDSDTFDPDPADNIADCENTVAPRADLAITKTSDPLVVYAGEQKRYRITVTNLGPSDAENVVVADTLPIEVDYLIDTGLCAVTLNGGPNGEDVLSCNVGTLPVGGSWSVDIVTKVRPDVPPGTILLNCATVTSTTPDIFLANNRACTENRAEEKSDLRIVKFGKNDGVVRAGDILTYTVIVDNLGPSWATSPAIKDVLQSAGKYDLIDLHSDRRASCSILPQGLAPTTVVLPPTPWPVAAPVPPLPAVGAINQRLELDCTLIDDPASPLPANEAMLQALAANGPPNAGRWILTMRVRARQGQDMDNVATTTAGLATDPDAGNNLAIVEHEIIDIADLAVTKTAVGQVVTGCSTNNPVISNLPNQVTAGLELTYTIVIRNNGPSDAENVVLYDRLPPGVVILPGSGTIDGSAAAFTNWCVTGTPGSALDQLTCGVGLMNPIVFPANSSRTLVYRVKVDPALAPNTILENDVRVASAVYDPNNANSYAHNQTTVSTAADLRLLKSHDPATLVAGELVRYTLAITNDGPSVAKNVWLYDDLPAPVPGTQWVKYLSAVGAACTEDAVTPGNLACQVGDMAPGLTQYVYLIGLVHPDAPASIVNNAVVQSGFSDDTPNPPGFPLAAPAAAAPEQLVRPGTPDPCPADNVAADTAPVTRRTDPFITKTDLSDPVIAGREATFQIGFGNLGPSTATNVAVVDDLPRGFTNARCEPLDPNDAVSCTISSIVAGDNRRVTLNTIRKAGSVVWTSNTADLLNRLDPGESFAFRIVATVEPGYVLDGLTDGGAGGMCQAFASASGYLFWAHDQARITSTNAVGVEVDANLNNNGDDECTRVNADADLEVKKTDVFGTDPANGFLQCDPVQPGGTITYDITVTNKGPSDAAMVQLTDWLPRGLVLDPTQVIVTVYDENGVALNVAGLVEKRDDGRITVIVGNSPLRFNQLGVPVTGPNQLGRLNAGRSVRVRIVVKTATTIPCGTVLANLAEVTTLAGKSLPTQANPWTLKDQTPTPDSNLANNRALETTTVVCPSIKVRKTVSYDGKCPGYPYTTINQTGQPVTFCFEVTNTGDTFLDNIVVTDVLTTRTKGKVNLSIACSPIRGGKDPLLPLPPGETVTCSTTIQQLLAVCDCGVNSDTVTVTGIPVNSGRTVYPCLSPVTASDTRVIEVPCAGVDFRLQLPVLGPDSCETWLQVQNVGDRDAKAILVVWGPAGACPPQAAGPLKAECSGLLRPGSAWSFALQQLPAGARSAVVYGVNNTTMVPGQGGGLLPFGEAVCQSVFFNVVGDYYRWVSFDSAYRLRMVWNGFDFAANLGEPLAVSVNRKCPDPVDPNVTVNAAYTGISSDMEGARDPQSGSYTSYAPLLLAQRAGLSSILAIQNSGIECTSLEIWFKAQDNCLRPVLGDVLTLAPGETVKFDPNTVVGPDWIGSAWIRSTQPLGIVVDTLGGNHFTSYTGVPGDVHDLSFSLGAQVTFAPLIYNQMQGWDTAIQVQNHSATVAAKVKVYFLDQGGDILATVVDWICPRGSQSFFLPVIGGLPGNWVGSVRVESQEWWTPGTPAIDPPNVSAVVLLEKWSDPARTTRREAVAYNAQSECLVCDWQIGHGQGGLQSGSAVFAVPLLMKEYRGITTELGITNLVPKPGFTDFAIFIYDQNGLLDYVCQKLTEKQVEYINLATWGYVAKNFNGSAVVSAVFWEHDVFSPTGGFQRNLVGLGGVAVERVGGVNGGPDVPGDESKAFEAMPIYNHFAPEDVPSCPGVGERTP